MTLPQQSVVGEGIDDGKDYGAPVGRRFVLAGRLQGLGVRPAIFHLANELSLGGAVRNSPRGVEIEVEGMPTDLQQFATRLPQVLPVGAVLSGLNAEQFVPTGRAKFVIAQQPADGPLSARVPEDRAVCPTCLHETELSFDRRFEYPFTSCTQCGPRYTVIRSMPFERQDTAMAEFPLCVDCRREYRRPRDRRFHAQTIACPACGPHVWCNTADDAKLPEQRAVPTAARLLEAGKIIALRGLGGYQLLVDATNQAAVERLRERKGRRAKPLAVMVESLDAAEQLAHLDANEREALCDPSGPIVLVLAKATNELAAAVHPHLDAVGLLLPTTPLHARLMQACGRPLVCTSGNREGEPLEFEVETAEKQLSGIADAWLHHNREITRPIDDSVVCVMAGRRVTLRLARGLAPFTLDLPALPPMLAVGGYLKSAVAWSNGAQCVLGPHVGDQETLAARKRFLDHLDDCQKLYRFHPSRYVHDMHPQYFSTEWVKRLELPTCPVQHHHAHVVAAMLEHGWLDRPVLGVAWDGTGFGTDGTIWGGEFLVSTAESFERIARLRPFRLPGGEAAIYEPWRTAVAICQQLNDPFELGELSGWDVPADRMESIRQVTAQQQHSPLTSSAGRLFDAAAALVLGVTHAEFDGQAAMWLEAVADRTAVGSYDLPLREGELAELDWRPMFLQLMVDVRSGVGADVVATRLHRSLAAGIVRVCRRSLQLPTVLAGGVFQNRLLTELVTEAWEGLPQPLGLPGLIPPNDGGLAAGQLAIAAAKGHLLPCA